MSLCHVVAGLYRLSVLCSLCLPGEVVWEETTAKGVSDSSPMTLYELLFTIEKRGTLQYTITGHKAERPPAVQRGEETDRWDWKL